MGDPFRWLALLVLVGCLGVSSYYRRRARRQSGTIPRARETLGLRVGRSLIALPLFLGILAYLINPHWMSWSRFPAPAWIRWLGVAIGLLTVPGAYWVFTSIGGNVSETVLTKPDHELVTRGPYRWIRHPLYTNGIALLLAIGLMAANWFILGLTLVGFAALRLAVVPIEERELIAKFGERYRDYMTRSGRFIPRMLGAIAVPMLVGTAAAAQDADLIVRNAVIWTGDSAQPRAQALAIRGDRLIAVGSNAQVDAHRAPRTRVIDAAGGFVTPGFIDDHTHFAQAGALLIGANLLDVHAPAAFAARVKEAAARMSPGAWLTGGDWGAYEDTTRGRFSPDRALIDSVSQSTAVLLNRWDRSAWLANGVALERAGLSCSARTPGLECAGGRATGRVSDSALARVRRAIAPKTFEQRLREARAALRHLAELGVTTIHDITPPTQLPVFTELKRRGELTVRVFARPTLDKWNELAYAGITPGFGDAWIRLRALKGFVDGIQGNSTARFYEPQLHSGKRGEWRDSTNTGASDGPGSGMNPPGNMERLLFGLDSTGWWANVHAIGDEAIDTVLDVMEKVITTNGPRDRRWRIIHSQVIRNAEVAQRYKRLGITAEVQPYHAIDDMRFMEDRIGRRARWAYAFKTFQDAGVRLLFGSDWPGTNASWYTANPMTIMYAAVTRQTLEGKPEGGWFPEQRLDLETSLRSYTVNNAWAEGEEASKGMLRAGMLADFVLIDRDLFAIPAIQIKDARIMLTVVAGRMVYER